MTDRMIIVGISIILTILIELGMVYILLKDV
jgi:hypothetical protein